METQTIKKKIIISREDMIGRKFQRWLVLKYEKTLSNQKQYYLCKCDCGTIKIVSKEGLVRKSSNSCGCFMKESLTKKFLKHGKINTKEYRAWRAMQDRCYNNKTKQFKDYGGRGITVCKSWIGNFDQFYKDIGPSPTKNHSLDRIDNNKGYSKDNCRWATRNEQANNTTKNTVIIINGIKKNMKEWAKIIGVSCTCLAYRIKTGRTNDELLVKKLPNNRKKIYKRSIN